MNTGKYALAISLALWANLALAGGGHHQDSAEDEHEAEHKGPRGGTLVHEDDFALEVTIFERGVPPQMRIYAYQAGQMINPEMIDLTVELGRLGGDTDTLQFTPQGEYLLGDLSVTEPHSFDISISATYKGSEMHWSYPAYEGRTELSPDQQALAGLATETAGARNLSITDTLFGVIAPVDNRVYRLAAPYPSIVENIHVNVGDKVSAGQTVATLRNTQTLQSYTLTSPGDGEVTARPASVGQRADAGTLLEVTDLSFVWVELSAFPASIEKLALGQTVTVYDLHHHEEVRSTVSYIAPQMTGGHIARARAEIPNPDGHWRPGMHLKADIEVAQAEVPLAIRNSALQSFRDMPVVFAKFGDTYEVRMVDLGQTDGEYSEVLGGLKPGTEYVTENSFLLKADVLKDGASHDH